MLKIILISTLILFIFPFAPISLHAKDFDAQKIEWEGSFTTPSLTQSPAEIVSVFSHDPIWDVNQNRGAFSVAVKLELPPSLAPEMESLTLVYNSQNARNVGLGNGFTWDLIMLRPGKEFPVFSGRGVAGELTLIEKTKLPPTLKNLADPSVTTWKLWRPLLEDELLLAYQGMDEKNAATQWIFLFPMKREVWTFNAQGFPMGVFNSSAEGIVLSWNEGLLVSVKEKRNIWKANIQYKERQAGTGSMFHGEYVKFPQGLKSFDLKKGEDTKSYLFESDGGSLKKVFIKGGKWPLFQAKYHAMEPIVRHLGNNPLKNESQFVLYSSSLEKHEIVSSDKKEGMAEYYPDLNGDGRSDHIVIDYRETISLLMDRLRNLKYSKATQECGDVNVLDDARALESELNDIRPKITIEMAVWKKGQAKAKWERDASLESKFNIQLLNFRIKRKQIEKDCYNVTTFSPEVKAHTLYFFDVNQDGLQDVLQCPLDSEVENLANAKNISAHIMQELLSSDGQASRNFRGQPGILLIQTRDQMRLRHAIETSSSKEALTNFMIGFGGFKAEGAPACHQGSMLWDFNHDGTTDILTGDQLHVFDEGGLYKSIVLGPKDLAKLIEKHILLSLSGSLQLADFDGNGIPSFELAQQVLKNPLGGEILFENNGGEILHVPAPSMPLLTELVSPLGGTRKLQYKNQAGIWVVNKVSSSPGNDQPDFENDYSYKEGLRDPFRGHFLGFLKTRKTSTTMDVREEDSKADTFYSNDISSHALLYKSRALIVGKVVATKVLDERERTLRESSYQWEAKPLSATRLFLFLKQSNEKTLNPVSGNVVDQASVEMGLDLEELTGLPVRLRQNIEKKAFGIDSLYTQILLQGRLRESSDISFEQGLPDEKRFEQMDKGDHLLRHTLFIDYNERGLPTSHCEQERCQKTFWDKLGRPVALKKGNGLEKRAVYGEQDILPAMMEAVGADGDSEQKIKIRYEPWSSQWVYWQSNDETPRKKKFNIDGMLESSSLGDMTITKLGREDNILQIETMDGKQRVQLDGFARMLETVTETATGDRFEGKQILGRNGAVLQQMAPSLGQGTEEVLLVNQFDTLGRITLAKNNLSDAIVEHVYNGPCHQTITQYQLKEEVCISKLGQLLSQSKRGTSLSAVTSSLGELNSIKPTGQNWQRDLYGRLVAFDDEVHEVDQAIHSPLQWIRDDWDQEVVRSDGLTVRSDEFGKVVKVSQQGADNFFEKIISYDHGKVSEIKYKNNQKEILSYISTYNEIGLPGSLKQGSLELEWQYDKFGRVSDETLKNNGGKVYFLQNEFKKNELVSLAPHISGIERNAHGKIKTLQYQNGLQVRLYYDESGILLKGTRAAHENKILYKESLEFDSLKRVTHRQLNHALEQSMLSEDFNYHPEKHFLMGELPLKNNRNKDGQVESLANASFNWNGSVLAGFNLSSGDKIFFTPDETGAPMQACHENGLCLTKMNDDLYQFGNSSIKAIRVDGMIVGIMHNSDFYPVLVDHLGSVRAMFDSAGKNPLWVRHYSAWGKKTVYLSKTHPEISQKLERLCLWSFASLKELPWPSTKGLYFSQTRVYLADIGEWASYDQAVIDNHPGLSGDPANYFAIRYCGNDPLNCVDPIGYWGVPGIVYGAISGGVGGYYTSRTLYGTGLGAVVGGALGFIAPSLSNTGGIAAVNALSGGLSNFAGQLIGNVSIDKNLFSNINSGAIIGAVIGNVWAGYAASSLAVSPLLESVYQGLVSGCGELLGGAFANEFGGILNFEGRKPLTNFQYEPFSKKENSWEDNIGFGEFRFK